MFVHRNVGNIVANNDWNLSAVLEFSINHLKIPDIVICGHYGCGGINALHIDMPHEQRMNLIVEENVRLQLEHLQEYPFVRKAMTDKQLKIHGWVYDMSTGEIKVVKRSVAGL